MPDHCAHCGTPTPNSVRLCDPCLRAWRVSLRRAQGLPDDVEDPALLSLLRRLVRGAARIVAPLADEVRGAGRPAASEQDRTTDARLSRRS